MLILRKSIYGFGEYYGNEFNSSNSLSMTQMQVNAKCIFNYFKGLGWSTNAISAMLGNMQAESSINPGRWQYDNPNPTTSEGIGYSLVQWTPYTKYTEWVKSTYGSGSDPSIIDYALDRIDYEVNNNLQWIATSVYPFTFKEFSTSTKSVSELAKAFLLNYERPADQSTNVQNYRAELANNWYTYLTGITPEPPTPTNKKKRKGFKFVLFNKRRRIYG